MQGRASKPSVSVHTEYLLGLLIKWVGPVTSYFGPTFSFLLSKTVDNDDEDYHQSHKKQKQLQLLANNKNKKITSSYHEEPIYE